MQLDAAVVSISLHHAQPQICVASFAVGSPSRVDFTTKNARAVPTVLLGEVPCIRLTTLISAHLAASSRDIFATCDAACVVSIHHDALQGNSLSLGLTQ